MKTKEELLKMTKEELRELKWSNEIKSTFNIQSNCLDCSYCSNCWDCSGCSGCWGCSNCSNCSDCSRCSECSGCLGCSGCSNCYMCRNIKDKKYAICNVELTEEEYRKKIKEIK